MKGTLTKVFAVFLMVAGFPGCTTDLQITSGELEVSIEEGSGWLHKHPLFLGISFRTPPQIAVWVEDENGVFLGSLYVSKKAAAQGWLPSVGEGLDPKDIRRPEALPVWSHRRGIRYSDGLYMPTANDPVVDAVTSATPKNGLDFAFAPEAGLRKFRIFAELNQSLDFNGTYPKDAARGTSGYSGGEFGSGQPSLVYYCEVDLDSPEEEYVFTLAGQGSADGSDGLVRPTLGITDAAEIVDRITARVFR